MNVLNELNSEIEHIERKHARMMNGNKPKHHAEQIEQLEAAKAIRQMNRSLDLLFAEIKL